MKTTNRLFVLALAVTLTLVCVVSNTFSWYNHNDFEEGNGINYHGDLELSIKTAAISMTTFVCDKNGSVAAGATSVNAVSASPESVVYYKTTLSNSGTDDVMLDLEATDLPNNADFVIGTISPTLNEKGFASRAVRSKTSDDKVRVYFKTHNDMTAYWGKDDGDLIPETGTKNPDGSTPSTTADAGSSTQTGTTNDINICYTAGGNTVQQQMLICPNCPNNDNQNDGNANTKNTVYYYDLPSNTDSFFFFNHWYLRSASNREWNRTIDIRDLSAGKLYYLTGGNVDGKWKEYKARAVDQSLVAVNNYYKSVQMSTGASVSADISLKKESETEDEEFVPDYYGSSISYSIQSGDSVIFVNKDGLITPKTTGTATVRTTVTGRYGDIRTIDTAVDIPSTINQVPIMKNIRVEGGKSVDVYWYARNNSTQYNMTTGSIFITQ